MVRNKIRNFVAAFVACGFNPHRLRHGKKLEHYLIGWKQAGENLPLYVKYREKTRLEKLLIWIDGWYIDTEE